MSIHDPFLPPNDNGDVRRDAEVLRALPPVNTLLQHAGVRPLMEEMGREAIVGWIREELDRCRNQLLAGELQADRDAIAETMLERLLRRADIVRRNQIGRVINATGVILHTGLGRAPLSPSAQSSLQELATACNLEVDLESGERRYRGYQLQTIWEALTGAEDGLVVNNNAAATLLALQALCRGREVIISRGQLIEIGGSFRLPEIFELSGAILKEVGTTNRTRLSDYAEAIGPETAAIMHVHPSNYRVVGFSSTPEIGPLAKLAHQNGLIAIDDIGSGALIDMTEFGLPHEPTFRTSLQDGADLVLGSGDKLLGGPQCGILLGLGAIVQKIRKHPLARAVRVGKLTLAALSATLDSYVRGDVIQEIPTLGLLATPISVLQQRAGCIVAEIAGLPGLDIQVFADTAPVGGGSIPGGELPTIVIGIRHKDLSAEEFARRLRVGSIRVFSRIQQDRVLIDLRSVLPEDDSRIALGIRLVVRQCPGTDA